MPGVQALAVVLDADRVELGLSTAGSVMASRWGHSALSVPPRDLIQAWSVGVAGRPKCLVMATMAMNRRVLVAII